jgi:hypothetical protein
MQLLYLEVLVVNARVITIPIETRRAYIRANDNVRNIPQTAIEILREPVDVSTIVRELLDELVD